MIIIDNIICVKGVVVNSHDKSNLSASSEIDENAQLLISDIFYFIRDDWEEIGWSKETKGELIDQILNIAYNKNYDWERLVKKKL